MNAHPTPEQLAEHAEGALDAADAAALDAHVAGCAACQAVQQDLRGLRTVLASDRPGPMPADVAARIDAALAGLSAARPRQQEAAAQRGAPDGPRPVDFLRRRRERYRRYTRLATVAAGLVLVVGGSVLGVQLARDPGPTPTSLGGPGGGEPVGGLAEDSGPGSESGSRSAPAAPEAGRVFAAPSGRDYGRAGFAGQVSALLRSDRVRSSAKGAGRELPGGGAAGEGLVDVSGCAGRLARQAGQPGVAPVAADVATWEGRPAVIIVLPVPGAPASVHAYVVPRDCAAQPAAAVPVLHDAVLPSPTPG
jgi:Putative zinc-finger